ncbi:MAG: ABC transporter ATP-binding protein [Candidatus Omnitrophota bacterium]
MIEIKHLSYQLQKKTILEDIDLTVNAGDFWLIFGPNGAGKTTLLKILCGLIHDFDGTVRIADHPIKDISPKKAAQIISYQSQFDEFSLPLKVKDILMAGRYPYKSFFKNYSEDDYRMVEDTIRKLNLDAFVERDINTLSGGERKQVMLASAFIQDVSIILFDEPFTFLDPGAISNLKKIMATLHAMGKTLIVVSHDFEILFPIVDHILALKNGKIVYSGPRTFDKEMLRSTYGTSFEKITVHDKEIIFLDD